MSELLVSVAAVRAALLAETAITDKVGSRVYFEQASGTVSYPYILISMQSGTQDNSARVRQADLRLLIKVVGEFKNTSGNTYADLVAVSDAVYQALHEVALGDVGDDWWIARVQRVSMVNYTEQDAEVVFAHVGGVYRVQLSK